MIKHKDPENLRDEPPVSHSPRLKRTIMDGPGNHSSIIGCLCGWRFDLGSDYQMCDWYAQHAGIVEGGAFVTKILRQYDEALDEIDYPDHSRTTVNNESDAQTVLHRLRTEA